MEFTEEIKDKAKKVCNQIIVGKSVKLASEEIGISEALFFKWLSLFPELHEDYASARAFRADSRFEKIDNILQEHRRGEIDYNTARLEIDTIKWQAGKEKAKVYGDKITQENQLLDKNGKPTDYPLSIIVQHVPAS